MSFAKVSSDIKWRNLDLDLSLLLWVWERVPEDNGRQTEFAPQEEEIWFQSFGVSVVCVSLGINTVSTGFSLSPRKVLWVITMKWHPDGTCTVEGILQSGLELIQMNSTGMAPLQILCICHKIRNYPLRAGQLRMDVVPRDLVNRGTVLQTVTERKEKEKPWGDSNYNEL